MTHKIYGTTKLLEETAGNSIVADQIASAERKEGVLTGVRYRHGSQTLVTIRLAPEVAFFAAPCDFGGRPMSEPVPLTPDMVENTWGLNEAPLPRLISESRGPEGRIIVREKSVQVNDVIMTRDGEQTITGIGNPFAISKAKHAKLLLSQPHTDIQVGDRVAYAYYPGRVLDATPEETRLSA